jgi:mevalonate kinase
MPYGKMELTNDYYLKLCGSGGGGILGFTEDLER